MRKIIIVRHGESMGNANNIIQGRNNNYGLTENGKKVTYANIQTNLDEFKGATRIISSPFKRALETADIISKELNLQVAEQLLLKEMDGKNIPKILCIQDYDNERYCKIIKHVKGKHKYGKLSNEEYNALIESERELNSRLIASKQKNYFKTNNLRRKIENIYQEAKTPYIRETADTLLNSKYLKTVEDEELYVLSHDDLNRDNILFEKMPEGKIRANIIDFESLERAPKDYQFASMLASGLLLEGESINKLKETIQLQNMDMGKILFFMQIRILEGLYFFRENSNEYVSSNEKVSQELLKKYFYSSEIIQKEMGKIRIKEGDEQER